MNTYTTDQAALANHYITLVYGGRNGIEMGHTAYANHGALILDALAAATTWVQEHNPKDSRAFLALAELTVGAESERDEVNANAVILAEKVDAARALLAANGGDMLATIDAIFAK